MAEPQWVCERCGQPGVPDEFTSMDARYTTGHCTGKKHPIVKQVLIRPDFHPTERPKKKSP